MPKNYRYIQICGIIKRGCKIMLFYYLLMKGQFMSDNLKYSIEKTIYKHNEFNSYFKISGYCYDDNFSTIIFKAKLNGNQV